MSDGRLGRSFGCGAVPEAEIASESLDGASVGDEHDDQWYEERHQRRVDGERPVKYTTRTSRVIGHHQHVTCDVISIPLQSRSN